MSVSDFLSYADGHLSLLHAALILPATAVCIFSTIQLLVKKDPQQDSSWNRELLIGFLFLAAIVLGRWPHFFQSEFFNPDEAEHLSSGLTLAHHPIMYKYADGHTSGPLNFYVLTIFHFFGFPINYFVGRLLAALLQTLTLFFTYRIFRLILPSNQALFAACPLLCFYSWMNDWETIMYSSEQVSTCLLIASLYFLLSFSSGRSKLSSLIWAGLLAGATPWAKLQTAPISLTLFVFGAAAIVWFGRNTPGRMKRFGLFVLAYMTCTMAFAALIVLSGQESVFFHGYILSNLSYAAAGSGRIETAKTLWSMTELIHVLTIAGLVWAAGALIFAVSSKKWPSFAFVLSIVFLFSSASAMLAPGRAFPHYTLLIVAPLGLVCGLSYAVVVRLHETKRFLVATIAALFIATTVIPLFVVRMRWHNFPDGLLKPCWEGGGSDLSQHLRPLLHKGDELVVWGWYPHLYVELQAVQGSRDGITERMMRPSALQSYYRERFLAELNERMPAVIVDAAGPLSILFTNPTTDGIPAYPDIMNFVRKHYHQVFTSQNGKIYLRNDRT